MENTNNEVLEINDQDLQILTSNKKISARILSLIEIVSNIILNQFFEFYSQNKKIIKIEYFHKDKKKKIDKISELKKVNDISYRFF